MKWRIYKEAVEEVNFKKLLKQNGVTKLPSGTQFKPDRVSWSKDGGYAGQKTLDKICSQLEDAGWKRGEWRTGGIPDGSAVTNSNAYTSPDGQLVMTYSEHFGATAHDNFYGFTFKLAGTGVNESDDWVGDDGGVEDDINPKFADLRDACDKIDDRGFQWSSGKWRIRPDELGYDWKIYYDGEGLIGAVNYKTREYDVWNTKVVNKHEIKDFLHALSADGFRPMSRMNESSRFGFNVGDKVELKDSVEPNRFSGREAVSAGVVGEVVAINKPMPGIIKVKIENGPVISVPERKLKFAGTDDEPWKKIAADHPPAPKPDIKPEKPEDYYMRPTSYGSPRYTGD